MSLINDALKRASESDRNRSTQTPLPKAMQPVAPDANGRSLWLVVVFFLAGVGLIVAGWFFLKEPPPIPPASPTQIVQPSPPMVAAPTPALQPATIVQKPAPPPAAPVSLPAAVEPVVAAPALPAPVSDGWPTNLTVKAIFYNKSNPRALVNGKTVETGDTVDGVLVTGILSDRVFVDYKGKSKVILMGGQ